MNLFKREYTGCLREEYTSLLQSFVVEMYTLRANTLNTLYMFGTLVTLESIEKNVLIFEMFDIL